MNGKKKNRSFYLPPIGQRLIKTAVAVFLCLVIYILRGYQGMVVQSAIAAIICMQPYADSSKRVAVNRVISTVMGGLWGLLFLLLMEQIPGITSHMLLVYLCMALGVLLVLYTCVLLKITDSAALAAIVFMCVIVTYPNVEAPLQQTFDRILDTIIGVCVAVFVNIVRLPAKKHPEKLFFLHLKDIAADRYSIVQSRILIELNRLYDEGARISLETRWAPAFMISQMSGLRMNMPIIVMDGAALYDMRENTYPELMTIPQQNVKELRRILAGDGICACIFAVRSRTMMLFHDGPMSEAEQWDYEIMRRSPYRNYMDGMYEPEDSVIAVRFLIRHGEADAAFEKYRSDPYIAAHFRIVRYRMAKSDDWSGIYFYRKDATIENMEKLVADHFSSETGLEPDPVHISPPEQGYDPEHDAHHLLHEISRIYMGFGFMTRSEK
ncbi:MAG: FUSC family protein [Lachnospiraceae bacterium]|nr:FUSC family protein [Lachnospiraceae bacterium]MBQ2041067.1 FUSC family protein [Lachnospiraceae bacterium]